MLEMIVLKIGTSIPGLRVNVHEQFVVGKEIRKRLNHEQQQHLTMKLSEDKRCFESSSN